MFTVALNCTPLKILLFMGKFMEILIFDEIKYCRRFLFTCRPLKMNKTESGSLVSRSTCTFLEISLSRGERASRASEIDSRPRISRSFVTTFARMFAIIQPRKGHGAFWISFTRSSTVFVCFFVFIATTSLIERVVDICTCGTYYYLQIL